MTSVQGTSHVFCQEWRNLWYCVPYQKFFMLRYITFKKKTSTRRSYVGHIRIAQWVKWVNRFDPFWNRPLFNNLSVLLYNRKFWRKENLMNSHFSSMDKLNVDKCLDFSKSYTYSVKVWWIKYWHYQKFVKFLKFFFRQNFLSYGSAF